MSDTQASSSSTEPVKSSTAAQGSQDAAAALDAFAPLQSASSKKEKKKHGKHRVLFIVLGCILAVILIGGFACSQWATSTLSSIQTVTVEQGTFQATVQGKGNLEAAQSSVAASSVDGTVDQVMVREGDTVQAGDVLYTVKNDDLDSQVLQAKASLDQANNQVTEAQNQLNVAQATPSVQTTQDADGNMVEVDTSATQIANAQLAVSTAQSSANAAQAAYDAAVEKADGRTVRATTSGTVLVNNLVPGTSLATLTQSGKATMQIGDMSTLTVKIPVSEVDITKVAVGQTAQVTFDAVPGVTAQGTVTSVANASSSANTASTGTSSSGSSSSSASAAVRYEVTVSIPDPDPSLKSGMTAHANIVSSTLDNVLKVPTIAINDENGKKYVTKVDDQGVPQGDPIEVQVVTSDDSTSVVTGDLQAGDKLMVIPSGSSSSQSTTVSAG